MNYLSLMKHQTTMKKLIVILFAVVAACSAPENKNKFIAKDLPQGVEVYGFNETFDKPYGKYALHFYLKNTTGQKLESAQVSGQLFIDGKVEGEPIGGPGRALDHLDSAVVSFAWVLPTKVPDSVVFKFSNQ